MKEIRVFTSDDLIFAETGEKVEAQRTHVIELDGCRREIDLNEENSHDLTTFLGRLLDAGHAPEEPVIPKPAGLSSHQKARRAGRGMKAYAREHDIPLNIDLAGKAYYPEELRRLYAGQTEAEQEQWVRRQDKWLRAQTGR